MNFLRVVAQVLVFVVGLAGYGAAVYGLFLVFPPSAYVVGGGLAMWWSWYVSVGAKMQTMKMHARAQAAQTK